MKRQKSYETDYFFYEKLNHTDTEGVLLCVEHHHNFYEIYYLECESCNYFIDGKSYHLLPGDMALIPPGVIHSTLYTQKKASRILINCSGKYIPASALALFSKNNYIYRNNKAREGIAVLLKKAEKENLLSDKFSDDAIKCIMQMIFLTMLRNKNMYKNSESKIGYIEKAVNYIQQNPGNDISLCETAGTYGVSPEHFSRKFKQETSFGFNEYVNMIRLKKASEILKTEAVSISDAAMMCGFNDSNYFSVKFRKMYGMSPKAYQLMARG